MPVYNLCERLESAFPIDLILIVVLALPHFVYGKHIPAAVGAACMHIRPLYLHI